MAFRLSTLQKISIARETTFGVTMSAGSFRDIPAATVEAAMTQDHLPVEILQARANNVEKQVVGRKTTKVTLRTHIWGAPTPLSASVTPDTNFFLPQLISMSLGGHRVAAGSTVVSSVDSGSFSVTDGTLFNVGQNIATVQSGNLFVSRIRSISTNAITLTHAFPARPSNGDTIFNAYTNFFSGSNVATMQIRQERNTGLETKWTGLAGNFNIEAALSTLPTLTWELQGASWVTSTMTGSMTTSTFAHNTQPPVFLNSKVYLYPKNTATVPATFLPVKNISIKSDVPFIEVGSPHGINNIQAFVRGKARITIELDPYDSPDAVDQSYSWQTLNTADDATTVFHLTVQIGNAAGRAFAVTFPRCQIIANDNSETDGIVSNKLTLMAMEDPDLTPSTNGDDLARSIMVTSIF